MDVKSTIAGLVLCGGESKRMGTDKGLIMENGQPWFKQMGMLIEQIGLPVYYSIRADQLDSYMVFADQRELVIDDKISEGPLRGVLSAVHAIDVQALLLLPCDMIGLNVALIRRLLDKYEIGGFDFYAFLNGKFYHPFPGIYSCTALKQLSNQGSLQRVLLTGRTNGLLMLQDDDLPNLNQPRNPSMGS